MTKWAKKKPQLSKEGKRVVLLRRRRCLSEQISILPKNSKALYQGESDGGSELPNPSTILGQAQVDPFANDVLRRLPPIAQECLEYTLMTLWPRNSPGLAKQTMDSHTIEVRKLAVHSPLQYYTLVAMATSACSTLTRDLQASQILLLTRLKHQTASFRILRDSIANMTDLPSDELIDCLSRMAAVGGDVAPAGFVSRYRQTPMADAFPFRCFGSFAPCIPHFEALGFLIHKRGGLENIAPAVPHTLSL